MAASRLRSLLRAGRPGRGAAAATALATLGGALTAAALAGPASAASGGAGPGGAGPVGAGPGGAGPGGAGGQPGNRYNVGATHSPQLLAELAGPVTAAPSASNAPAQPGMRRGVDVACLPAPQRGGRSTGRRWPRSGIGFAAVKATEGTYYRNPYALSDLAAAPGPPGWRSARTRSPSRTGTAAAKQPGGPGRLPAELPGRRSAASVPVMLDIEYDPYVSSGGTNQCYGLQPGRAWCPGWPRSSAESAAPGPAGLPVHLHPARPGGTPAPAAARRCASIPLWVPELHHREPARPCRTAGPTWKIWQYSSAGTVPGIHDPGFTDLDRLQRGVASLGP